MFAFLIVITVIAAPPSAAGRRVCGGQEVETNPNWGRSFATAARFGLGYTHGHPPQAPPASKTPEMRSRFLNLKFAVNPWNAALPMPSKDLWLAAPMPLR